MSEEVKLIESEVKLVALVDANDIVAGLSNNDELILPFILQVLDYAGSSELEERLRDALKERSEERSGHAS